MKKVLIIGIVVVVAVVAWLLLRKKSSVTQANSTVLMYPAPIVKLKPGGVAPEGSNELSVISIMTWLNANNPAWATKVRIEKGFSTQVQALAFIAITEGKTDHKTVSLDYAGFTIPEVIAWIKKYV